MLRLVLIEQLLRRRKDRGASYEEISDFLEDKFQEKGLTLKFTERTFQRDKVAIADVFGIQISFSRKSIKTSSPAPIELQIRFDAAFGSIILRAE